MNEFVNNKIKEIDQMLEKNNYKSALKELNILATDFPEEGIIPYYLGRLCVIVKEDELALKFFLTAIKKNYVNAEVYLSAAIIQKEISPVNEAEISFIKAIELATNDKIRWACMSALTVFYIENQMYLKAKNIVRKLISSFPNNYQGYHLNIVIDILKENYEDVNAYMDKLSEKFKDHPQYLIDLVELYKKQDKTEELMKMFEEDTRFNDIIPQVVLREKIQLLPNGDEKEKFIRQLATEYHESDAVLSVMIIEFGNSNFEKAAQIANIVLDNEKHNAGYKYYLALYFQIFSLYYLAEKRPSAELRKWIERAGNWCINFVLELNIPSVTETVRTSIQELFDEINAIGKIEE